MYAVYTGLLARTQALDTASNNLANASTSGFRAQRDYFRSLISSGLDAGVDPMDPTGGGSQVGNTVNSYGFLGGSSVDLGQGALVPTGNPLDLGLSGAGFFALSTAQGVRYTRDGQFVRSATGQLQTPTGEAVLDDKGKAITLPSGEVEISADGTISVGGATVAKVGVYTFPASVNLQVEGTNRLYAPPKPDGTPNTPTAGTAEVHQGQVEGSNQDSVHGTMNLVLIERQAEMMQKALSVFDNDFDKTATEQLARV